MTLNPGTLFACLLMSGISISPETPNPRGRLGEGPTEEESEEIRKRLKSFCKQNFKKWDEFREHNPKSFGSVSGTIKKFSKITEFGHGYFTEVNIPGLGSERQLEILLN